MRDESDQSKAVGKAVGRAAFLALALAPVAALLGYPRPAQAAPATYTVSGYDVRRALNASQANGDDLADVLATHLADHNAGRA